MGLFDNLSKSLKSAQKTVKAASRFAPPKGGHPTSRARPVSRGNFNPRARLDTSQVVSPGVNTLDRYKQRTTGKKQNLLDEDEDPQDWSKLLLESVSSVTDSMGNIMHSVKVMDRDDKKDNLVTATGRVLPGGFDKAPEKPYEPPPKERKKYRDMNALPESAGNYSKTERNEGVDAENAARAESLRDMGRAAREKTLGLEGVDTDRELGLDSLEGLTKALSTKEYNALTTRQRAAVDYNTLIAEAVRKDLANQDDYADLDGSKTRARYDKTVKQLFGKDRGSDVFAPETVAVLKQLAFNPTLDRVVGDKLADLDDYLGLKATVTENDLPALAGVANRGRSNILNEGMDRSAYVNRYADMAEDLTERMVGSRPLLQSLSDSATLARFNTNQDAAKIGGLDTAPEGVLGFNPLKFDQAGNPKDLNTYFAQAFENIGLAQNKGKEGEILGAMSEVLKPDELDAFFKYADIRSRDLETYGLPTGKTENGDKFRTPQEFRKTLGLDRLRGEQ